MITRQIPRFALVGLAATAVHFAVGLIAATGFGLSPLKANTIAFVSAFGISYLGNTLWTFGVEPARPQAIVRFAVLSLAGFAGNQAIVMVLTGRFGWSYPASLVVALLVIPPLTFVIARSWALADRKTPTT